MKPAPFWYGSHCPRDVKPSTWLQLVSLLTTSRACARLSSARTHTYTAAVPLTFLARGFLFYRPDIFLPSQSDRYLFFLNTIITTTDSGVYYKASFKARIATSPHPHSPQRSIACACLQLHVSAA
ncbi:hypothetical protein COCCADRAFT_82162 [Bipolaris zeicola 26-R-13]|uniref:Uncharacterized protein n=1 Tax=Cochliobolus carbonum (strain 26-R-13) TaxID=930089 RepID=W6YHK1_COCC2|nr:uncharacterized protein COCCADRAFT_82162 [Bipolaris zeicola 26-R-13]EUC38782.1 hypothetical protein COCCADRAFT_82162 [Bipolaris zeicola 26-R-13]